MIGTAGEVKLLNDVQLAKDFPVSFLHQEYDVIKATDGDIYAQALRLLWLKIERGDYDISKIKELIE